jgi:hypothetical protein
MAVKGFDEFVEDFKKDEVFERYGPELALIKPGNWNHFIEWARAIGYEFDLNDLKCYFVTRKEVLEKIAQHPTHGAWGTTLHTQ